MTAIEAAVLAAQAAVIAAAAGIPLFLIGMRGIVQARAERHRAARAVIAEAEQAISTGDITRDLMRLAHSAGVVPE